MKTTSKLIVGFAGVLCLNFLLPGFNVRAADLAVDNLTVGSTTPGSGNATGVMPTKGSRYIIVEQLQSDTDLQRGAKLLAAYQSAKDIIPAASANGRITVLIPPGAYDLGTAGIILNVPYIDLIGIVPVRFTKRAYLSPGPGLVAERTIALYPYICGLRLYGSGNVIRQSTDNVRIANMVVDHVFEGEYTPGSGDWNTAAYWPDGFYPNTVIEHVRFSTYGEDDEASISMRTEINYPGTYRDCVAGHSSFGRNAAVSGTFEDCVGGNYSFAGHDDPNGLSQAAGFFTHCSAGDKSFGGPRSATGKFKNCFATDGSFGGSGGKSSGTFEYCVGLGACFNGIVGNNLGTFKYCFSNGSSFNNWGGKFENCESGANSFHFPLGSTSVLRHCKAGAGSFGSLNIASSDFNTPLGDLSMGSFNQ
jgi:hypothetical protein